MRLTRIRRVAIVKMETRGLESEGFVQVMRDKKKKKKIGSVTGITWRRPFTIKQRNEVELCV